MNQKEFVNTRREGMVQLYQKLAEFYKQEGAFDYLELEDIEEMIKDIDRNNIMNWNKVHGEDDQDEIQVNYPEDVLFIRKYFKDEKRYSDCELEKLWEEFSEDVYCAQHMRLWQGGVEEFEEWLKRE